MAVAGYMGIPAAGKSVQELALAVAALAGNNTLQTFLNANYPDGAYGGAYCRDAAGDTDFACATVLMVTEGTDVRVGRPVEAILPHRPCGSQFPRGSRSSDHEGTRFTQSGCRSALRKPGPFPASPN